MQFEHLVAVNDANVPHAEFLTRAQLWAGLMYRVDDARPFLPGLDGCQILSRRDSVVERRLNFGAVTIDDRASFAINHWVRFETATTPTHGGGLLTIRIEEPEPMCLFLRFTYNTMFARGAEAEDAPYAEFLRQAYMAADIDTVRVIRTLVTTGVIDAAASEVHQ
ncbi:MAG: DUF1857 family protein [Rhodocyclaceae bacterium]|nr:DUF1857 family protein [Rhodocyclaceae bacterium]